jgi:predicted metal-dependent hydrolase
MTTILPTYRHIVKPKLKNIYLSFDEKGTLVIKSPKVSQDRIEKLLIEKSQWIQKTQYKLQNKKGKLPDLLSSSPQLYFKGEPFPIVLNKVEYKCKPTLSFSFEEHCFQMTYYLFDEIKFQKEIESFYAKQAKIYLPSIIESWSSKMSLLPSKISYRKSKKQWGSCSHKDAISFNTMVMKLPKSTIEYIVVHELAHIKYKHHQKVFWELVEKELPYYRIEMATLKGYSTV